MLTPKSTHERVIPLIPELRELLTPALRSKLPTARVVLTSAGTTPRRSHVLTVLKYYEKKLGLRAWSFHALRHFFISELVRRRVSVEVVRILAGHSTLAVTQRYIHAEASELRTGIRFSLGNWRETAREPCREPPISKPLSYNWSGRQERKRLNKIGRLFTRGLRFSVGFRSCPLNRR